MRGQIEDTWQPEKKERGGEPKHAWHQRFSEQGKLFRIQLFLSLLLLLLINEDRLRRGADFQHDHIPNELI